VVRSLEGLGRDFEVIVVCDGALDDTAARVRAVGDARVRAIEYPDNQGKGFAVCVGIAHADGRLVGWLDADLDIHPGVIVAAARMLTEHELDAVVGSKRHPASEVEYPVSRRILSWGFQRLVRVALRVDVRDTQTGAKVFRREVLETVVPLLLIKRYAFDLEVLAVGALFGFDRVEEVPVRLEYRFTGSGINSEAVRRMFLDTMAITYRVRLRHWYVRQFATLHRSRLNHRSDAVLDMPTVPASNLAAFQQLLPDDPAIEGRPGEPI
jgi:glycosyltransferase involved in cell wall biosynthesis